MDGRAGSQTIFRKGMVLLNSSGMGMISVCIFILDIPLPGLLALFCVWPMKRRAMLSMLPPCLPSKRGRKLDSDRVSALQFYFLL